MQSFQYCAFGPIYDRHCRFSSSSAITVLKALSLRYLTRMSFSPGKEFKSRYSGIGREINRSCKLSDCPFDQQAHSSMVNNEKSPNPHVVSEIVCLFRWK
ncbi:hypothetical protein NPIL_12911 [Nephila pilipes]|uniref:Uncharacterized protein n=1 Tax=Nephila pilipes TaxID=299642 RepID=A0A8X6N5E0_NEPPI|nr:hypothetical protein NPIL_368351 [Nephila pilipes]GFU07467.1 hypothetical protein NPIL_12911 [Nephila pilipes]